MRGRALATGGLLLVLGLAEAACLPFARQPDGVHVLVFNIHAGKDAKGRDNLSEVAHLVRTTKSDLVLLQEVDRGTARSGGVDQLKVLSDATGREGAFGRTLDYDGGQYGIAALSRRGFSHAETRPLPVRPVQTRAGGSHEPRGAQVLVASTRHGSLLAFNTHLDASGDDAYRLQEVEMLLQYVRARIAANAPVVVGGDFNAEPESPVIKRMLAAGLRDVWAECGRGDGFTYPSAQPVKRIDYLFVNAPLRCTRALVVQSETSDHKALLVTLTGVRVKP